MGTRRCATRSRSAPWSCARTGRRSAASTRRLLCAPATTRSVTSTACQNPADQPRAAVMPALARQVRASEPGLCWRSADAHPDSEAEARYQVSGPCQPRCDAIGFSVQPLQKQDQKTASRGSLRITPFGPRWGLTPFNGAVAERSSPRFVSIGIGASPRAPRKLLQLPLRSPRYVKQMGRASRPRSERTSSATIRVLRRMR